jgi:phenylalanyl-tRNA synthetase alpha chain
MSLSAKSIDDAREEALSAITQAHSLDALKEVKIAHVGDRSPIARANQQLGSLSAQERATFGKIIGQAKSAVLLAFAERERGLEVERDARVLIEERVDVSIPARRVPNGGLHPLTILTNEICDLFLGMGYRVAEGPELEAEWLNFDALNIPADHPARTMQDTFFVEPLDSHLVLRTHTSPVQVRTMLEEDPPIYVICPGRTYRADELDATHTPVFSQVEGLVIDKGITMAHLKGTLDHFARSIFGTEVKTRLRSSFFLSLNRVLKWTFILTGVGSNGAVAAWLIPEFSWHAELTQMFIVVSPLEWGLREH